MGIGAAGASVTSRLDSLDIGSADAAPDKPAAAFTDHLKYRPDIDGLRTVAVLSVVLFHLGSGIITGGFAGVDIFFVISGYLITGIVQREIVDGRFSVLRFYERRMRRIFPALFAMLAGVLLAGLLIFMPDELKDTGASFLATATFLSNILFWMQADYFAGPVDFKPLLHTWSLAVEEQFYLIIPPLMFLLHRWNPAAVKPAFATLFVLSFAASCAWVFIDPSGNYYLPHTRAWELLVGSVIAMGMVPRIRSDALNNAASVLGLLLLLAPLFILTEDSVFPAWNALAPCIGAGLLIHTGDRRETVGRAALGFRPIAAFGLISYSLYLVHWPLIVFAKYQLLRDLLPTEKIVIGAAMVALAWLSWRFIEAPFRDSRRVGRSAIFMLGAAGSAATIATGAAAFLLNGLPQRFGNEMQVAKRDDGQTKQSNLCFMREGWQSWEGEKCFITPGHGGRVVMLWGDSHANHYVAAIEHEKATIKGRVLYYASAGCAPVLGVDFDNRPHCRENNDHALEVIKRFNVKKVVLSSYWQRIFDDNDLKPAAIDRTMQQLRALGVEVAIIGDNPDYSFANPNFLAVRLARRDDPKAPYYTTIRNRRDFNGELAKAARADRFVDPMADLCKGNDCLVYSDGNILMRDNAHLSTVGARLVLQKMPGIFD